MKMIPASLRFPKVRKDLTTVKRKKKQRGASLVEYALLIALIAVLAIVAIRALGMKVSEQFSITTSLI